MSAATLDMLMIAPRFCRLMRRRASRVQKKVPLRWMPIIRCQASSVICSVMSQWVCKGCPLNISPNRASDLLPIASRSALPGPMPALLTSTSSVPSSRSAWANIARTCPLSATSAVMANPRPPGSLLAVVWAASPFTSLTTTRAPSSAKSMAMAWPIPEPAPVTSATRFCNFMVTDNLPDPGAGRDGTIGLQEHHLALFVVGAQHEDFGDEGTDLLGSEVHDRHDPATDELLGLVVARDLGAGTLDSQRPEVDPQTVGRAAGLGKLAGLGDDAHANVDLLEL